MARWGAALFVSTRQRVEESGWYASFSVLPSVAGGDSIPLGCRYVAARKTITVQFAKTGNLYRLDAVRLATNCARIPRRWWKRLLHIGPSPKSRTCQSQRARALTLSSNTGAPVSAADIDADADLCDLEKLDRYVKVTIEATLWGIAKMATLSLAGGVHRRFGARFENQAIHKVPAYPCGV